MDRRNFLRAGAAGLTGIASEAYAGMLQGGKAPRVAVIGPGWYGKLDLFRLIQVAPVEVVSIADPDGQILSQAAEMISQRQASKKKPQTYKNYKDLLKAGGVDLVLIDTPDHWHALPFIDTVRAGFDVYMQKPISRDVIEGEAMVAAAKKYGRVVQVGLQRRSTPHLVEAKKRFIDSGEIGTIGLVELYCYYHMRANGKPPNTAPPAYLDYDLWTGPAPMRPYNEFVHPGRWRSFTEYSNGILGDMCVHMLDMSRWMMGLGWPKSVSSSGGILVQKDSIANVPDTQTAMFDFGGTKMVWQHRTWGAPADPDYPWGATFYGDKGTLKVSVFRYDYIPMDRNQKPVHADVSYELEQFPEDKTEPRIEKHVAPAIRRHMQDLLAAMATRGKTVASIEEGHISTSSCILANMSLQLGRTLHWDPATQTVIGDPEATKMLARQYRAPYIHPDPKNV